MKKSIIVALAGLTILVGAGCKNQPQTSPSDATQNSAPTASSTPSVVTSTPPAGTAVPAAPIRGARSSKGPAGTAARSYIDSLNHYRSLGAYLQLLSCHGNPGRISMKRQVQFMVDNQDVQAHVVGVGSISYRLAARGFAIVSAPDKAGEYYVTCDGGGAALLSVQQ